MWSWRWEGNLCREHIMSYAVLETPALITLKLRLWPLIATDMRRLEGSSWSKSKLGRSPWKQRVFWRYIECNCLRFSVEFQTFCFSCCTSNRAWYIQCSILIQVILVYQDTTCLFLFCHHLRYLKYVWL